MSDRSITGTLEFVDLGSGSWVLVDDHGERWQLAGAVPANLKGRRVTVAGRKSGGLFGFGTGGQTWEVDRVQPA